MKKDLNVLAFFDTLLLIYFILTLLLDMLNRYEYIPSLNDIRSQRAVRIRLETLEKLERKRQEKLKGERSRREKQEVKEKEKELKKRQRLEV